MKRKSGRKSAKKSEDTSNGVEEKNEQNGDTSESNQLEVDEAPIHKKRKSGKSKKKSAATPKKEEASTGGESEQDSEEEVVEDKKTVKGRKSSKKYAEDPLADVGDQTLEEVEDKKPVKKAKKSEQKDDNETVDEDDDGQYEVEEVLDEKMVKGMRHYLIRWKGYEEESDTWEPENTLDCAELIQAYKDKTKKSSKAKKTAKKEIKEDNWDENEDFEVDRILEVHHKRDGKREFLVSWKGYSATDNSWEPEENMNCKDLIVKFMEKVDKAKQLDDRELRVKRKQVQRFTLRTQESGRRLSKRFRDKERVQYHDAE